MIVNHTKLDINPRIRMIPADDMYVVGENDFTNESDFSLSAHPTWNMDEETFWMGFNTNGADVCLYGEFSANAEIRFFFTDDTGFDDLKNDLWNPGQTDRVLRQIGSTDSERWNFIFPHIFMEKQVTTWYVFVSVADKTYPAEGHLFGGRDDTAPNIDLDVDPVVKGTVSMDLTLNEPNCNLSHVEVTVGGDTKLDQDLLGKQYTTTISWDSTKYPDGLCSIHAEVSDTAGNVREKDVLVTILNIEPTTTTTTPPPPEFPEFPPISFNITNIHSNLVDSFVILEFFCRCSQSF
jgi:hypothetical protein